MGARACFEHTWSRFRPLMRLLAETHDVTVLDDFSTGRRQNLQPFLDRIRLVEASVTDPSSCRRAVDGTLKLLVASKEASVKRFVYAGSSSAYGDTTELPKHEGMVPRPRSPYAVSKLTGEQYCAAFFATYGLETVTLRYFNVFGARQDPTSQYAAVIPKFITAALCKQRPTIYGDGEQTRDFTYISNVVDANLRACVAPSAVAGQVFNVGAGAQTTLNQLWREIRRLTHAKVDPIYEPARAGDVRDSLASLERTRSILGFTPSVPFAEGLALTVKSYPA
jgi:nucleoside-diphosphate-sugar epimerase